MLWCIGQVWHTRNADGLSRNPLPSSADLTGAREDEDAIPIVVAMALAIIVAN